MLRLSNCLKTINKYLVPVSFIEVRTYVEITKGKAEVGVNISSTAFPPGSFSLEPQ